VVALHGLWDQSYGWAIRLSQGLGGEGWDFGWPDTAAWVGLPTGADLVRFQVVYNVLLGVNGILGTVWVIRRWRAYRIDRWKEAHPKEAHPEGTPSRLATT
jgi:protease PrsW